MIYHSRLTTLLIYALMTAVLLGFPAGAGAQPAKPNAAEIYEAIKKLNVTGSVLYVAAHPDDENTQLISWLANEKHLDVTYLSLTRGDGGQNLIGPEIQELLGVIRTQELLMARKTDGGKQFFSRAIDFGYSKSPAEALRIWGEQEMLSDVVWAIRKLRPDIIINRFSTDTTVATHGHHTASAILSAQAFDMAGDPGIFPEQLQYAEPWQPERLFYNTSWFFYSSREDFEQAMEQKKDLFKLDVGTYFPLIGKSNTEIAAESRSMHRCQGFGVAGSRGSEFEYLQLIKGSDPEDSGDPGDIFDGIDLSWDRVPGGKEIGPMIEKVLAEYDLDNPAASITGLTGIYNKISSLPDSYWKNKKLEDTRQIIRWCLGIFLEAAADLQMSSPGQTVMVDLEAINRSGADVRLRDIRFSTGQEITVNEPLQNNTGWKMSKEITLPADLDYSSPYWLQSPWSEGRYTVEEQPLRGRPESPEAVTAGFNLSVNGISLRYEVPLVYKETDPARGEVYHRFEVVPPVFVNLDEKVYVFNNQPGKIVVRVTAGTGALKGKLGLGLADGWDVSPAEHEVDLEARGEEKDYTFTVIPPNGSTEASTSVQAVVTAGGQPYNKTVTEISYDHIPSQVVLRDATSRAINLKLEKKGERIAYIMGAGDDIPASLRQIGYKVDVLAPENITPRRLSSYDALITGIRAYNTVRKLQYLQDDLLKYVENGGTMIVQYNTNRGLVTEQLAPYPLRLSRDRVSEEDSPVRFLDPGHPVLNAPNKISEKDFEGWIQERGLYFASRWDPALRPVISANDTGETPKNGGLLVGRYGKGYFVYTGYSWFRQLPAGVPGAYRLFVNLISLGK